MTMNESEKLVMQILDAYKDAVFAKDVNAFVTLYDQDVRVFDQDVRVFDMWGRWSYDGKEAWLEMVTDWFGSLGTERVEVEFSDVQTTSAQDVAVAHAFVTYKGLSAEGETLRALQNRTTMVLRQMGDAWKILHEHSSAPADFETLKVILQR